MTDPAAKVVALKDATSALNGETTQWPLSFKIQPQPQQGLEAFGVTSAKGKPKKRWWSHLLYRGPNNERVKIQYSKTKADSEVLAQQFLKEKVVGFDMEWPWDDWRQPNRLQNKIGLIQVATEDKIALFHIGLHTGDTIDDLLAPSLRKLIESPEIGKIGVGILNADFARLSRYFKLKPKGAVELSHLHRLVTFGGRKPELVSTKMTSLANQVEQHLEHPLYKGDVRTSNWSKPLSQEQIKYAAGDAYAGIMLYHCLNYKRLQMKPTPPLPIHADKYLSYKLAGVSSLYLESSEESGKIMTSAFFFGVQTAPEDLSKSKKTAATSRMTSKSTAKTKYTTTSNYANKEAQPVVRRIAAKSTITLSLDSTSQALHDELCIWRKAVAAEAKLPAYRVASDQILLRLAGERPLTSESLLKVRGLGIQREKLYGKQMIGVISSFMAKNGISAPEDVAGAPANPTHATMDGTVDKVVLPATPDRSSRRRRTVRPGTPDSSPALGTPPPPRTPQLHTGLSFTLAETKLAEYEDSDDSVPSLDFGRSPSRRTSGRKRKRMESPTKHDAPSSSQKLQQTIQTYRYSEGVSESQPLKVSPRVRRVIAAPTNPPSNTSTVEEPLTPRSKIFRNKLVALSRQIATKQQTKPDTIVSAETLEAIARNPPRTHDKLRRMPGVEKLLVACVDTDTDLLAKIQKFAPMRSVVRSVVTKSCSDDRP
ncbi:hypothetical protein BU25DRAFT_411603 [Macroventuria anomochaeta]|uniref:Uncharacterized protein n=1 Tax=Macroventuria anomochaeta TaxID=301207 RepID=A0ACB6RZQ0_9PLEO|nr:uncharacterized protein BU25DRAFT_411603 [Macroventuria anomochaeta]KAF2626633.1 hypothetical protein BU25DRAFT_411603 [Macroventuria anomochaeta]